MSGDSGGDGWEIDRNSFEFEKIREFGQGLILPISVTIRYQFRNHKRDLSGGPDGALRSEVIKWEMENLQRVNVSA